MKKMVIVIICLVFSFNFVACSSDTKGDLSSESEQLAISSASDEKDGEDIKSPENLVNTVNASNIYSIGGKEFMFPRTMGEFLEQIESVPGVVQVIVRNPNSGGTTYYNSKDESATAMLEPEERISSSDAQLWICTEEMLDFDSEQTYQKARVEFGNNSDETAPMTEAKLINANFFYQPESYQHMDFHLDNIVLYGGIRLDGTFTVEELEKMFPSVEEETSGKNYELKTENIHFYIDAKDGIVESVYCYFY